MASITGIRTHRSSWYPSSGWTTNTSNISVSLQAGPTKDVDGSSTKRKLMTALKITTSSGNSIDYISKITITAQGYRDSNTSGNLRASICDTDPSTVSGLGDSVATIRNIAVSGTSEMTDSTNVDTTETMTFNFTGTFTPGKTYYIVFYTGDYSVFYIFTKSFSAFTVSDTSVNKTYKISYNANGGTGAPSSQTKTHGVTLTLSSTKPTKANSTNTVTGSFNITGDAYGGYFGTTTTTTTKITASTSRTDTIKYTFNKWNTASNGSGTSYAAGAKYTANAAATLYAQYTSSTTTGTTTYTNNSISALTKPSRSSATQVTYTITYVYGNGSSNSTATCKKIRSYSFKGWSETKGGTILSNSKTYTSAKTVYASWEETDSTESTILPTPTKTGYTFMGWSTNQSASSGTIGSYTPSESVTLYAIWKANGAVRIYIEGQGYKMAQVYLFTTSDNKWHLTIPYLYDGLWHISS